MRERIQPRTPRRLIHRAGDPITPDEQPAKVDEAPAEKPKRAPREPKEAEK